MSIPGPLLLHRVEQDLVSNLLLRPPQLQNESGPVRIGKVQKKPFKTITSMKKGVLVGIVRDNLAKVPIGWLTRPFSGLLWLEVHLLGLAGCSASRLKPPNDGLPRPYMDPQALVPRPCKCSSIPLGGD